MREWLCIGLFVRWKISTARFADASNVVRVPGGRHNSRLGECNPLHGAASLREAPRSLPWPISRSRRRSGPQNARQMLHLSTQNAGRHELVSVIVFIVILIVRAC